MQTLDAIIQARLGSTRLPSKVLSPVAGRPLLERVIARLKACRGVNRVIVATTREASDDQLARYCEDHGILCHRGETDKVLDRFLGTCDAFQCERILRVCSDNPFLDSALLDAQIKAFKSDQDYCTYVTEKDEPIILKPIGVCAEAVTRAALERVRQEARDPLYAEHVTMYIYRHPEYFTIGRVPLPAGLDPEMRFTIDYPEDVAFCEAILAHDSEPDAAALFRILKKDPALAAAMTAFASGHQKAYRSPTH